MSSGNNPRVSCPSCEHLNEEGYVFCSNCGSPSSAVSNHTFSPDGERRPFVRDTYSENTGWMDKKIDQTRTGLLLLVVGLLLSWIPYVQYIGWILELIGVIFVIIGRDAFGARHGQYVIFAVVIYSIGFIAEFMLGLLFAGTILSIAGHGVSSSSASATMTSAFESLLWGSLVITVLLGISTVMLVYLLEAANGRTLLWLAFAAQVAMGTAGVIIVGPLISHAIALAFASSPPNTAPRLNLDNELNSLRLLGAIPAVIFGFAYYLALKRIDSGSIPERAAR